MRKLAAALIFWNLLLGLFIFDHFIKSLHFIGCLNGLIQAWLRKRKLDLNKWNWTCFSWLLKTSQFIRVHIILHWNNRQTPVGHSEIFSSSIIQHEPVTPYSYTVTAVFEEKKSTPSFMYNLSVLCKQSEPLDDLLWRLHLMLLFCSKAFISATNCCWILWVSLRQILTVRSHHSKCRLLLQIWCWIFISRGV